MRLPDKPRACRKADTSRWGYNLPDVQSIQLDTPRFRGAGVPIVLFDRNPKADDDDVVAVEAETGLRDFLWVNVKMQ